MTRSMLIALLAASSLGVLGACATADTAGTSTAAAVAPAKADVYAGKSVLDAAIDAAGGQAALSKAKELDWSGAATINAGGKTTEVQLQTIVRPFTFGRTTSWEKSQTEKQAKTIQMDFGKAWSVNRVTWTPMPAAQEKHEIQQYALYGVMALTTLKDPGVKVTETAPGKDGTRNLHVEHPKAPPMDLRFDASGKLVHAAYSVVDPEGKGPDIKQDVDFSGEVVSNGVKWPQKISIKQNGAAYFDLSIDKFEARGDNSVTPLIHTLDDSQTPARPNTTGGNGDAG
ncbi:MAG TPA: hypothetical protein VGO52_18235 [Hyphomonadaceae bacterium]|jgi:hypothetical protein|nr:hypothetical protein [Hyphomonadaceae bacterium]